VGELVGLELKAGQRIRGEVGGMVELLASNAASIINLINHENNLRHSGCSHLKIEVTLSDSTFGNMRNS